MKSAKVLDAKGLACPMPIVRTKKAMNELESGQILEVHVTDKGAKVIWRLGLNPAGMTF